MSVESPTRQERVREIIAAHFEAIDAGKSSDWRDLIRLHPDLSEDLAVFFKDSDKLLELAEPLKPARTSDATPTLEAANRPKRDRVPCVTTQRQFGSYELIEEIARGGMGVVFKARQVKLGRVVALKMILAGQFATNDEVQRFRGEAEAAALLSHPNIVPIYEVGEQDGHHYFSMQWIDGGTLAQHRDEFADDPHACAALISCVARAVHYAHQRGILHRDLKPGNILLTTSDSTSQVSGFKKKARSDQPKAKRISPIRSERTFIPYVTDFGLAKRMSSDANVTRSGDIVGTPNYMAPEQAAGRKDLTMAADTYALGAILYELLTSKKPFQAETPMATLMKVQSEEPASLRSLKPALDRDIEIICLKCLDKDPRRRYATADDLADDLERWIRGEPISARAVTTWERVLKWARRRPAAAVALVGFPVFFIIAFVLVTWQWYETTRAKKLAEENALIAEENARKEADARAGEVKQRKAAERARAEMEQTMRRLNASLYGSQILLAERDLAEGKFFSAGMMLGQCAKPLRHWEWNYLNRRSRPLCQFDDSTGAAYDALGKRLAVAVKNSVKILDAESNAVLREVSFPASVAAVCFSGDGTKLAACGAKTCRVWEVETGKVVRNQELPSETTRVALDHEGNSLLLASEDRRAFLVRGEEKPQRIQTTIAHIEQVRFSSDGKRFALGGKGSMGVWETESLKSLRRIEMGFHAGGCAFDSEVRLGVASNDDGMVLVYDLETGKETRRFPAHDRILSSLLFSKDDKILISGGTEGTTKFWDFASGDLLYAATLNVISNECLTARPDNARIAVTEKGQTKIWSLGERDDVWEVVTAPMPLFRMQFTPDSKLLITCGSDRNFRCFDVVNKKQVSSFRMGERIPRTWTLNADGTKIAAIDDSLKTVHRWKIPSGEKLDPLPEFNGAVAVAFHADDRLAVGLSNGAVFVFEGNRQVDHKARRPGQNLEALRYVGDTLVAAFTQKGKLCLYDVLKERCLHAIDTPFKVSELQIGEGGNFVLAQSDKRSVRWIDLTTDQGWNELPWLAGHNFGLALSEDNRRIVMCGVDNMVRISDTASGQQLLSIHSKNNTFGIAISPDRTKIATGGIFGKLMLWDVSP